MPRPHVKIKQRDLKGESHMFKLKEGAEGRETFQFKGGVRGGTTKAVKKYSHINEPNNSLIFSLS